MFVVLPRTVISNTPVVSAPDSAVPATTPAHTSLPVREIVSLAPQIDATAVSAPAGEIFTYISDIRTFALESRVTAGKRIQAKRLVWATQTKIPPFRMPRRLHPRHPLALRKNQGTTGSSQFPLSDGPNLRFLKWNVVAFIQLRQPLLAQTSSRRHLPRLTSSSHRRKVFSMLEMPACSHTVRAPLKAIFAWW
jgi:hypothetical protein